jgi:hypothetical protein
VQLTPEEQTAHATQVGQSVTVQRMRAKKVTEYFRLVNQGDDQPKHGADAYLDARASRHAHANTSLGTVFKQPKELVSYLAFTFSVVTDFRSNPRGWARQYDADFAVADCA